MLDKELYEELSKPRKSPPKMFPAQWGGKECPRCYETIEKGQLIMYNEDGALVHARHKVKEVPYEICNLCFLTLPCECTL